MRDAIRRWRNPLYRRAHRYELPTRLDVLTVVLTIVAILGAIYITTTYSAQRKADAANATAARVLGCLNGHNDLGGEVSHGHVWRLRCTVYEQMAAQ